jgi:hypothetical protein
MRSSIAILLLIIITGVMTGCASNAGKSNAPTGAQADKTQNAKACVMQSGGADVLRVSLASNIKCDAKDGTLHINAPQYDVYLWLVPGAQTIDEGVERIGQQIKDQFKDFKETRTSDLIVAGSPAKRLIGSGHEADDGDNGQADVIVFKVANHIFIACVHGEDLTSMAEQGIVTVVQTAHAP